MVCLSIYLHWFPRILCHSRRTHRFSMDFIMIFISRTKWCLAENKGGNRVIKYYQPKLANVQRLKLTNRALVRSYSLWPWANALNVSFKTLYGFQSTLLTQLLKLNYPVILSHPRSTKISLETSPSNKRKLDFFSIKHLMHKPFDLFGKYPQGNK